MSEQEQKVKETKKPNKVLDILHTYIEFMKPLEPKMPKQYTKGEAGDLLDSIVRNTNHPYHANKKDPVHRRLVVELIKVNGNIPQWSVHSSIFGLSLEEKELLHN